MTLQIYEEEWYQACVDECAAILTEKGEESKIAILELHYLIGRRVLEDVLHWERAEHGKHIIENLASDIFLHIQNKETAARRLWECIQFARRFPDLCDASQKIDVMKLPAIAESRLPSWRYIVQNLLSDKTSCIHEWEEKKVVQMMCKNCGRKK